MQQIGAITGYIDVAQVSLYVFWGFFAGLIYYLRREDKREGYPLVTEREGVRLPGFPLPPKPKTFYLKDGRTVQRPRPDEGEEPPYNAIPVAAWPGAPLQPQGNPMLSAAGPAAYAMRADVPDMMQEVDGMRILPLRIVTDHHVDEEGPNPLGQDVISADGLAVGRVFDLWVDRAETTIRYVEVELAGAGAGRVLVPFPLVRFGSTGRASVVSTMSWQFADAPRPKTPDAVTLREEDQIQAYFASGHIYATPSRMGPLL